MNGIQHIKLHYRCFLKAAYIFIFAVMFSFICKETVYAASATVSVTAKSNRVTKGDTVYVIITVKSSDLIGGFKGYFGYDNSVLKYVTGGNVMSGNDDEFYLTDTDREEGSKTIKYSIKFIARKDGNTIINLKKPYAVYSFEDESEMSVSYNELNIVVEKKKKAAKAPNPTSAGETQPQETTKAMPTASPKATKEPAEQTASPKQTKKPGNSKNESNSNKFKKGITSILRNGDIVLRASDEYTVMGPDDKKLIPEGFSATNMKVSGRLITVYASESDTEHKFVLIYAKTGSNEPEFYLYDKEEENLVPYEKVQSWYRGAVDNAVVTGDNEADIKIQQLKYIIAIMAVFCLLLIIIIISIYMHFKGFERDELTEVLTASVESAAAESDKKTYKYSKKGIESEKASNKNMDAVYSRRLKEEEWKRNHAWQGNLFDDKI